jgi:hypothetical protein
MNTARQSRNQNERKRRLGDKGDGGDPGSGQCVSIFRKTDFLEKAGRACARAGVRLAFSKKTVFLKIRLRRLATSRVGLTYPNPLISVIPIIPLLTLQNYAKKTKFSTFVVQMNID